jgi:hypothetical protein
MEIDYDELERKDLEEWHESIWGRNYNPYKRGALSKYSKY